MIAEKNIQKFLEGFNRQDKVHLRVLKMLTASCSGEYDVLGMADDLVKSSVNVENLRVLLDEHKRNDVEGAAAFDDKSRLKHRFQSYSTGGTFCDDPHSGEATDNALNEEMAKRLKISELQEHVNKYSEGEIDNVVDSLKSARECVIPGLESLASEGDSDERSLHGAGGSEKHLEMSQNNSSEGPQVHSKFSSTGQFESKARGAPKHGNVNDSTHRSAFGRDGSKDSVLAQNILPVRDGSASRHRDPSYLYPVLQCKLCGLRFAKDRTEQFGLHIEDHRRKTKALGDKMVLRREFFSSKSVSRTEKLELEVEGSVESIVWEKEAPYCVICGRIIKKVWSDDVENWVLDCGAKINDKEFAHRDCVL